MLRFYVPFAVNFCMRSKKRNWGPTSFFCICGYPVAPPPIHFKKTVLFPLKCLRIPVKNQLTKNKGFVSGTSVLLIAVYSVPVPHWLS